MNGSLLKYHLALSGETQQRLSEVIGIGLSTLNAKINGKADFTRKEIVLIKEHLGLSTEDVDHIFFN